MRRRELCNDAGTHHLSYSSRAISLRSGAKFHADADHVHDSPARHWRAAGGEADLTRRNPLPPDEASPIIVAQVGNPMASDKPLSDVMASSPNCTIMDRPAPARADDDDRLRLPPVPAPQAGQRGEKGSLDRHPSPACLRSAKPFSSLSRCHRRHDVLTVANPCQLKICQSSASSDSQDPATRRQGRSR